MKFYLTISLVLMASTLAASMKPPNRPIRRRNIFKKIGEGIKNVVDKVKSVVAPIVDKAKEIIDKVKPAIEAGKELFKKGKDFIDASKEVIDAIFKRSAHRRPGFWPRRNQISTRLFNKNKH